MIVAIDPGPVQSAYAITDVDEAGHHVVPTAFDKVDNLTMLRILDRTAAGALYIVETVASYGMPVGSEVFQTCMWIGRFVEHLAGRGIDTTGISRQAVRIHHCHSVKANDATVRQALVDRFAPGVGNHGKGTKANPGFFRGFRVDVWQAYALAVYAADRGSGLRSISGLVMA